MLENKNFRKKYCIHLTYLDDNTSERGVAAADDGNAKGGAGPGDLDVGHLAFQDRKTGNALKGNRCQIVIKVIGSNINLTNETFCWKFNFPMSPYVPYLLVGRTV